ncbi:hypothetical protein ACW2LR_000629 [Acinetobacter baumannii]|uniref:hypothetical protein n=1 Tax=Acinetobacter baumannii TaxID=470 RepID=UPI0021BDD557|nr:hypothetical protein [Acinetobacter baumannii]MCJ2294425.1 hypothetical protein [Acinetobacter baumannii]MCX3415069.1 hypothetical protein [Acinetobacter baumannii]MDA0517238.1 hypothetical protein [Acinetobacter baumannii]MDA0529291.1 hypothetical protein [Acinetobacter baumannii]MDA0533190.1 hypothetical protein [Acinetobacter baumannii]
MDKFEEFYKQNCLDHFGYDPDLNWIFEKHEDGSYIQIEVENAKKVFQHQQAKVEELQKQLSEYIFVSETLDEMYVKEVQKSDELQKRVDKAIRLLVEAELYQSEPNIDLAVKALKGEG